MKQGAVNLFSAPCPFDSWSPRHWALVQGPISKEYDLHVCLSQGVFFQRSAHCDPSFQLGCSPEGSMFLAFMALTCHDLLLTPRAGGFRLCVALRLLRLGGQQKMPGLQMASSRVLVESTLYEGYWYISRCFFKTHPALDFARWKNRRYFHNFPSSH